jgi:hypothetical protein
MRRRASRPHAVAAALLLALGALVVFCATAGVVFLTAANADRSMVGSSRAHDETHTRHDAVTPRAAAHSPTSSAAHGSGLHVDVMAALAAVSTGALLLLGWFVVARVRHRLPRLVTAALGARAPPAPV